MSSYNPRSKRPGPTPESSESEQATPNQVDALLGTEPAKPDPAPATPEVAESVEEVIADPASEEEPESVITEAPSITVTVAQSPVEPAGPPGPAVAKIVAAGAGLAALIGGLFAWRRSRSDKK